MDIFKLRNQDGVNEFEAEGSQDYVEQRFDSFVSTLEKSV